MNNDDAVIHVERQTFVTIKAHGKTIVLTQEDALKLWKILKDVMYIT